MDSQSFNSLFTTCFNLFLLSGMLYAFHKLHLIDLQTNIEKIYRFKVIRVVTELSRAEDLEEQHIPIGMIRLIIKFETPFKEELYASVECTDMFGYDSRFNSVKCLRMFLKSKGLDHKKFTILKHQHTTRHISR